MSPSPIQPLFTTSPLILPSPSKVHNHQSLFVTSPISNSPPMEQEELRETEYRKQRGYSSSHPSSAFPSIQSSPVFETLSFAKVPIPPSSTTVSTDSEAFSSDWAAAGPSNPNSRSNSQGIESKRSSSIQSPSLISCLFQSTSIVNSNTNNDHRKSSHSPTFNSQVSGSKPILRRDTTSTSASEDNRDQRNQNRTFGLGINKLPTESGPSYRIENDVLPPPVAPVLRKRPSVLTFAVSQCSNKVGPSQSRSTSVSPTSSYAKLAKSPCVRPNWGKVRGQSQQEIEEENDEDEEDEDDEDGNDDYMVQSPLPISGHGESEEEDQGYVEDEEDGFTTDEDEEEEEERNRAVDNVFGNMNVMGDRHPARSQTTWNEVSWNKEYLNTPKRRSSTIPPTKNQYMTSTDDNSIYNKDDNDNLRGRKTSICINSNTKPSQSKCTRHRSPPPPIKSQSSYISAAPPAARSPSAADLCRRRGSGQDSCLIDGMMNTKKGWKSDDSAFFPPSKSNSRPPISKTNSFKLPSASSSIISQTQLGESQLLQGQRKKSLPTPQLENKCSTRSILKQSSQEIEPEPSSIPMIRSSGENKIPPKTPPLDNNNHIVSMPTSVNLIRRGSEPVKPISEIEKETKLLSIDHHNHNECLARSAIGYEEEEMNMNMNMTHGHGHGNNHNHNLLFHNRDRGIRII